MAILYFISQMRKQILRNKGNFILVTWVIVVDVLAELELLFF